MSGSEESMADYKQGYIRLESGNWIAIREAIGGRDACAHKARRLLDDGVPMWATAIPARTHVRLHGQSDANKRATDARRVQVATMEILVPGSRHSHLHVAFPRRRKSFIVAELAPLTNTTGQSIQGCALLFRTATLSPSPFAPRLKSKRDRCVVETPATLWQSRPE